MDNNLVNSEVFDEIVFENKEFYIKKFCFWPKSSLWLDEETGLFKVNLPGSKSFKIGCIATYAFPDGKRAIEQNFNYLGSFHEGLAKVAVEDDKYGFVNKNMEFIIEPKYNFVRNFKNGFSIVSRWDEKNNKNCVFFIDKIGTEYEFERIDNYNSIDDYSNGMFMVSDLKSCGINEKWVRLAYFSDYENNAGFWGYTDKTGKEIIKPQFVFAFEFEKELALVCKGKWTEVESGKYDTEEKWGMIDKHGNEVIPCKFDEIKYFSSEIEERDTRYLQAHFGGWKEGKWGIIDYTGVWVIEPVFGDLYYDISIDDCIEYSDEDKWNHPDEIPIGIYSIKEKRILFEPQFTGVDFIKDGTFKVQIYNSELDQKIEQIIDRNGKVIFNSRYTYLFDREFGYETMIRENDGRQIYGLIDINGNEILPCKYETSLYGFLIEKQMIIYKSKEKYGLITFDENIIIEAQYTTIKNIHNNFLEVKIGGKDGQIDEGKYGLITFDGSCILPLEYNSISIDKDIIIARNNTGTTLYKIINKIIN
jgi:hypothetical protein